MEVKYNEINEYDKAKMAEEIEFMKQQNETLNMFLKASQDKDYSTPSDFKEALEKDVLKDF